MVALGSFILSFVIRLFRTKKVMTHTQRSLRKPQAPRFRTLLALRNAFVVVWLISLLIHVEYVWPLTPFGPIADGSSYGYEHSIASGFAGGAFVVENRRRSDGNGWELEVGDRLPYVFPFFYGNWPIRAYAFPLFIPALLLTYVLRREQR